VSDLSKYALPYKKPYKNIDIKFAARYVLYMDKRSDFD
jgi:hypothetical protein